MKRCALGDHLAEESAFAAHPGTRDGLQSSCTSCMVDEKARRRRQGEFAGEIATLEFLMGFFPGAAELWPGPLRFNCYDCAEPSLLFVHETLTRLGTCKPCIRYRAVKMREMSREHRRRWSARELLKKQVPEMAIEGAA